MFKLCTGICLLTCIAGLSLLVPVAGSARSELQRVAQESLQASRPAAERGWQAHDRQPRVNVDKPGVHLFDLNNAVASTVGRQTEAQEDESASMATWSPNDVLPFCGSDSIRIALRQGSVEKAHAHAEVGA